MTDEIHPYRRPVPRIAAVTEPAEMGRRRTPFIPPRQAQPMPPDQVDFGTGNSAGHPRYSTYGPDGNLISRTYGRDDGDKRSR